MLYFRKMLLRFPTQILFIIIISVKWGYCVVIQYRADLK